MEFSRPEYWSGELFLSPGDLPNPGIETRSLALQADSWLAEPPGKPKNTGVVSQFFLTQELNRSLLHYASLVAQRLKHLPAMRETHVRSLGQEDPLEKEMATHSTILAWRIPWTEDPGRLQSTEFQRVGHDWATSLYPLSSCITGGFFTSWATKEAHVYPTQIHIWHSNQANL